MSSPVPLVPLSNRTEWPQPSLLTRVMRASPSAPSVAYHSWPLGLRPKVETPSSVAPVAMTQLVPPAVAVCTWVTPDSSRAPASSMFSTKVSAPPLFTLNIDTPLSEPPTVRYVPEPKVLTVRLSAPARRRLAVLETLATLVSMPELLTEKTLTPLSAAPATNR